MLIAQWYRIQDVATRIREVEATRRFIDRARAGEILACEHEIQEAETRLELYASLELSYPENAAGFDTTI